VAVSVGRRVLVAAVCLGTVSGALAAQGRPFPWTAGDTAPPLVGIRLGDRRSLIDSLLGTPDRTTALPDSLVALTYARLRLVLAYSEPRGVVRIHAYGPDAALGNVRIGGTVAALREHWGDPDEEDGETALYIAGRWFVFVHLDTLTQRAIGLGLAALPEPPRPYVVPDTTDVFRVVEGTWDWAHHENRCQEDPHSITFTPDRAFMILTFVQPDTLEDGTLKREWRYEIRGHTRSIVRGFIHGETRTTPAGELVVWDLVLMDPDTYRWHRTDWEEGGYTGEVVRCAP
jgi:hypothetical protein